MAGMFRNLRFALSTGVLLAIIPFGFVFYKNSFQGISFRKDRFKCRHQDAFKSQKTESQRLDVTQNRSWVDNKTKETVLVLFWSTFFGDRLYGGPNLRHCRTPCEYTANLSRVARASVMIIHARDPYPLPPKNYSHIPLVLLTSENPVYTPMLSNPKFLSNFNYLMSYRPDLADFFLPTFKTPSIEPKPTPFVNKTGLIAAVFSNCETARTAYLKELMKHIKVDSYGSCLRNKKGLQDRYQGDFKRAKLKLLRNYKFTVVFHNQDCDYFVDDQLTYALNAGTIPVYMGTDKVDELLGGNLRHAIIKVRDFATPKKLAEYLVMLSQNEHLYNRYLTWKYEGFQFSESFLSTPQGRWMQPPQHLHEYCDVCNAIAASRETGQFKKKGSVKPEYCNVRKVEDWLPILKPNEKESKEQKKLK